MNTKHCRQTLAALVMLNGMVATSVWAAEESEASLKAETRISEQIAVKIALAKVPGGEIRSAELEREHGKLIWSFDISMPSTKNITEVQVDAKSGDIVSEQIETPGDQAKEAAADHK